MDVKGNTFRSLLPSILGAISRAHFVSFDLELSGIPGKQAGQSRLPAAGKQTLQERYEDTKKAAERYQILQLGLTCVEEDREHGVYVLRPYNFYLNPVPDKKLDVEREVTFQSGAVEFLLGVGFRIDAPFVEGVPYFSRGEEARARATAIYKRDRNNYADIQVKEGDTESLDFVKRVQHEIRVWMSRGMPDGFLNITPLDNASSNFTRGLNGFQKRLVHQLVRSEFPDVVSLSKPDFIQLLPYDQEREDTQAEKKNFWFEQNLASQIGLRWIAEAMCPTIDMVLDPMYAAPYATGNLATLRTWSQPPITMAADDREACDRQFKDILLELRQKKTVVVGHNVFLDLIYFYSCFFGPLPNRVEEFQHIVAEMFPMVFDTKYLADKINNNSASYNSSLEDLDRELSKLPLPTIEVPPEHDKYASHSPAHEAGFDSYLTAKVLIRLAARIEAENPGDNSPPSDDDVYVTAPEYGGVALDDAARAHPSVPYSEEHVDLGKSTLRDMTNDLACQSAYSHDNPYALLQNLNLNDQQYPQSWEPHASASKPRPPIHTMMPHGDSSFWHRYGNKLRVNGTVEEVCVIW